MAKSFFKGQSILITGGTGSFGRSFAKKLLQEDEISRVIIFSRDEWKQWEMQHSDPIFASNKARYFLGDVRDSNRLERALNDVQLVVHAAALKQVPAAEYNPTEFIKTNILGAMNVIDMSIQRGVERVIALSTDKAVNPVNLYGATKLCADKLFIAGNSYVGKAKRPLISVVRYGNVLGSRGSLVPYWKSLIANGAKELPITDHHMTRFWITLEEAVNFVYRMLEKMQGEEIFVPKIPTITIQEMAKALAPNLPLTVTGIREGEKLHEQLISNEEARYTVEEKDFFAILPPVHARSFTERMNRYGSLGKRVPSSFAYTSDTNPLRLEAKDISQLLS